jgi:hypothetical protein
MEKTKEGEIMPYRIVENDGEYCVEKTPTGEQMGCHNSEDDAISQMRALYAAEDE